jgi:hypothetical protein
MQLERQNLRQIGRLHDIAVMKHRRGLLVFPTRAKQKKETTMKSALRHGLAAALLLSSVGVAAAAGMSATATDSLKLTSTQEHTIWQSVSKGSTSMNAPKGFTPTIGAAVPSTVSLKALPSDIVKQVPAVQPYEYAMFNNEVLIVNPMDKKVVDIIRS